MRNKFSDLIEQGVASFNYTPLASNMPETDMVCRIYNNIFSIPSRTHMSTLPEGEDGKYVITGSMIKTQDWGRFISSSKWGAINFSTSGYWSVSDLLYKMGLQGAVAQLNGDTVYMINTIPTMEPEDMTITMPASYTTTESMIPHPITEISTTGDVNKIKECFKDNLTTTVKNLNESMYIRGGNWIEQDGNILGYDRNNDKVYILNILDK